MGSHKDSVHKMANLLFTTAFQGSMDASLERNDANPRGCSNFLKILSRESLTMLAVPRSFVKHLNKTALKTTATLFSQNDEFWHVQVLWNQDDELDVQFGRGWELFVRAHNLKLGNSVLFTYEGNTVFSVKIFRSDGCCAGCEGSDVDVFEQDPAVKSENCEQPTNIGEQLFRFEKVLRSYNVEPVKGQIFLPRGFVSAAKSKMISLDCLGRLWPVRLWVSPNYKRFSITSRWMQLVREAQLEEGDKCIFEPISEGVLGLKIERKS